MRDQTLREISIAITASFIGGIVIGLAIILVDSSNFKVPALQARGEVLQLPNGTVWKRIYRVEEAKY